MGLELGPVLLAGVVVLELVGHVPDRVDLVLLHLFGHDVRMVHEAVVDEHVGLLHFERSADQVQELAEGLPLEALLLDHVGEHAVTLTERSADRLAHLVATVCPVLD